MKKIKMERIVKTYYDSLEEGKVLGRKCLSCGHVEFPPYLCCNECGGLDTEWIDLTHTKAHIRQILPPLLVFPETEYKEANGGFMAVSVKIDDADPVISTLVHVDASRYDELHNNLDQVIVHPTIVQGDDMKVAVWELDGDEATERYHAEHDGLAGNGGAPTGETDAGVSSIDSSKHVVADADAIGRNGGTDTAIAVDAASDPVVKAVIACAAEAYEEEADSITLATDIRDDLSNQSMKMIAMIAGIEEELGVTIEIPEAGNLNTILDFVNRVKEKMGEAPLDFSASVNVTAATSSSTASVVTDGGIDAIAQTVIACAAEAYEEEADSITLDTDIREDLSNQSMKMIAMIAGIEEELGVTIEIPEAGNLNTIQDFVDVVKSRL